MKLGGPAVVNILTRIINQIISSRSVPNSINGGILHPIHKKDKPVKIAGNYRGITITSIICKVLDSIHLDHQEAAIHPKKCDTQFSFTKGRAPTQASIIMAELMSEAKEDKKPLYFASLDIEKAFDVISHPHLLRKHMGSQDPFGS